jgi:hypothetical protein
MLRGIGKVAGARQSDGGIDDEGLPGADIKNTGDAARLDLSFASPRLT